MDHRKQIHIENTLLDVAGCKIFKVDRSKNKYLIHNGYVIDLHYILYDSSDIIYTDEKTVLHEQGYMWNLSTYDESDGSTPYYIVYDGRELDISIDATGHTSMTINNTIDLCHRYGIAEKRYPGFPIVHIQEVYLCIGRTIECMYTYPIDVDIRFSITSLSNGYVYVKLYRTSRIPVFQDKSTITTIPDGNCLVYDTWVTKKGIIPLCYRLKHQADEHEDVPLLDIILALNKLDTRNIKQWKGFEDVYII